MKLKLSELEVKFAIVDYLSHKGYEVDSDKINILESFSGGYDSQEYSFDGVEVDLS